MRKGNVLKREGKKEREREKGLYIYIRFIIFFLEGVSLFQDRRFSLFFVFFLFFIFLFLVYHFRF